MKKQFPLQLALPNSLTRHPGSTGAAALLTLAAALGWPATGSAAPPPAHDILAANITVIQLGFDNPPENVIVTNSYAIGDFQIRATANRGDYDVQMGEDPADDVEGGMLMTSVAENGRDNVDTQGNPHVLYPGVNFVTSHIDYTRALGAYYIPTAMTLPNATATTVVEYNINVSAAWFPYNKWLAGFARNSTAANGGVNDLFTASPGLVLGTHFTDLGGGRAIVNLTNIGVDSRTDGVLLVVGAKNEDNYALANVNTNDGSWQLVSKDNGTDTTATEHDPFAFVFIPKTNTLVVSGRFLGDATIDMFSGNSPEFTVANIEPGRYELKLTTHSPRFGVLLISPEGGFTQNRDNIVTFQMNDARDGWIIESRDLPGLIPALESPGIEPVASFVFIPGPTPGIAVNPTNSLFTTENGDTAAFGVVLDTQPTSDVTITLGSSNPTEGIASPATLTFTPADWNFAQLVTVTGQDDGTVVDPAVAYSIILSNATSLDLDYAGMNPPDVALVNADNDSGGITINPTSGLVTTEAGGTATFTVRLNTQPTGDVTFGLTSSDTTEGTLSPPALTFTSGDWNVDQTVTVTPADDFLDDGNVAYSIITATATSSDPIYNGQNPANVSVTNVDNDVSGIVLSPTTQRVIEGTSTNFTVVLTSQPTADVTVALASSDTTQGGTLNPASLTFTPANWSTPQPVTLNGANDLLMDGDTGFAITNTISSTDPLYAALAPVILGAVTLDNEAALTLPSGDTFYGVGTPGIGIDGRAAIVDPHTASYNLSTLTARLTMNVTADDRLEIRHAGTEAGQIGVSGGTVSYGGTAIGTFTSGDGVTNLVVVFNNDATLEAITALLRSVTFRNVSSAPSLATRTVSLALTHPDGGTGTASKSIRVGLLRVSDFQQGADRGYGVYTNAADIELFESQPDTAFPFGHQADLNNPYLWVDAAGVGLVEAGQVLLRFGDIVGTQPGQIPPGATIVSAELTVTTGPNPFQGDGSPLHRMLVDWDSEFSTWNSVVAGIQTDDVEARSTYDSQLGIVLASGDTGNGPLSIGVTADIQAWVNGETNHGWALPTWLGAGTDGLGFSPCEATNIDVRPRLRIVWVPTNTPTASFRQDVNGYTNAHDTRLRFETPDIEGSTLTSAFVDWTGSKDHVLIRFDDIIGTSSGQIPSGARIEMAVLDLATVVGNGFGDGGQFFAMLSPWDATNTWNSMIDGITADGVEAAATPTAVAGSAALNPNVCGGFMSFDLTSDVQAWASGVRNNYGWAVLPWVNGGDGWGVSMAESATERERPRLRVFYTPPLPKVVLHMPAVSPASVVVGFSGAPNQSYHVLRATTVIGPWTTNGTVSTDGSGTGTHTDSTPPSGGAFYRVFQP